MGKVGFLERIIARIRAGWLELGLAGDPIAGVPFFEHPWSIVAQEPAILDLGRLKCVEHAGLDGRILHIVSKYAARIVWSDKAPSDWHGREPNPR